MPAVGDEVVLRATVTEFFNLTQLTSARLVSVAASGLDVDTDVVGDRRRAAARSWPTPTASGSGTRASGCGCARAASPPAAGTCSPRTADCEIWVIDRDDPLPQRTDPYARRVFRDPHPLDNQPTPLFDDGNGHRIMLGSLGVKATTGDSTTLLPPVRSSTR